ncbi:MAG: family N-acetyltransferase [Ramlibacter sp.]|nr:family N-acetyltransferase [Ramlibacter sp.]
MASTEVLAALSPGSRRELGDLVAQSGWNQLAEDWALFHRLGTLLVVRDAQGVIVASGAVLPYGDEFAWISMILVAPAARGQGLGSQVFQACMDIVCGQGRTAMLDATPAGEKIYRQFGFEGLFALTRWQRDAAASAREATPAAVDQEEIIRRDAAVFGISRSALLADFLSRAGGSCIANASGFALVRAGRVAHQVGPLVADGVAAACGLLQQAIDGLPGRVFLDVADERSTLNAVLRAAGFTPQRGFLRMALGPARPQQAAKVQVIAGPEYG